MRAAVYHGAGDIRVTEVPIPEAGPGELLLRVSAVGICGTDAHEYRSGPHMFPKGAFIPGHEFAGHVVSLGDDVEGFGEGDIVASGAGISCGRCHRCRRGSTNLCSDYTTLGLQLPGGLAQYVVAPADVCLEVGSLGLSPDFAALAQPMAIAVHGMRRGSIRRGEAAMVVGAGGIGAFITYALAETGATTHVFDLDDERLEIARRLGATSVSHPDSIGAPPLSEPGTMADVVYEVTGTPPGLELALGLAGPGTRVVLVGLQGAPVPVELRDISLREIELIGTNAHVFAADFAEAARLLASRPEGWSDVAPTALPLDDLVDAGLQPMNEGRPVSIKTLIDPWATEPRPTV
jgi:(R,R)-butanediol dehydrogenase/meso-butanediol dehydrogenase/diacetyl reductase